MQPSDDLTPAPVPPLGSLTEGMLPSSRHVVKLAIRPSFQSFPALVQAISATEIRFVLDRSLESGAVLALQLGGADPGASFIRQARVLEAQPHPPIANAPWHKDEKKPFLQVLLALFRPETASADRAKQEEAWLISCQLSPPLSPSELATVHETE